MCPHCGQAAPVTFRNGIALCSVCHQPRGASAAGVLPSGELTRAGGTATKVFAWVVLVLGLLATTLVTGFFAFLFSGTLAPWLVGAAMALTTLVVFGLMMWGGRSLKAAGDRKLKVHQETALVGLAASQRGVVRAAQAAAVLGVPVKEAEQLLGLMCVEQPGDVTVEVADDGSLYYSFPRFRQRIPVRVDVAAEPPQVAASSRQQQATEIALHEFDEQLAASNAKAGSSR